jgi:hypothetical protein
VVGSSTYAALAHGRVDAEALRNLLARHRLHDGEPIYAVDVSTWPRCDAETSPERGFYYHPSGHSAGQPNGRVTVRAWAGLHPKQQLHPTRGTTQPRPIVRGTLVRVHVSRIPANTRPPQVLWLWWQGLRVTGPGDAVARLRRRFDLEHDSLCQADPSRRGFPQLRCAVGSPTKSPIPCGRSPGRPTGSHTGPARRYPAIKKAA